MPPSRRGSGFLEKRDAPKCPTNRVVIAESFAGTQVSQMLSAWGQNIMSASAKLSTIRQVAITVSDVQTAVAFYHNILGLDLLFRAGANLAFLDADGVRIMLTTPQGAGTVGANSILYFRVKDIVAVHDLLVGKGAVSERAPALSAKMPDHDLWTGFLRDPDGNLVGLMEEKRG